MEQATPNAGVQDAAAIETAAPEANPVPPAPMRIEDTGLDMAFLINLIAKGMYLENLEDVAQFTGSFGSSTSGSFTARLDLSALGISDTEDVGSLQIIE